MMYYEDPFINLCYDDVEATRAKRLIVQAQ